MDFAPVRRRRSTKSTSKVTSIRKFAAMLAALVSATTIAELARRDRLEIEDESTALAVELRSVTNLAELEFNHGIALYHELKYPPDYSHLEYLNPEAPKGRDARTTHGDQLRYVCAHSREGDGSPRAGASKTTR